MSEIIERLTLGQTETVLEVVSDRYEEISNRQYLFAMDGCKVLLFNHGDSLQLRARFDGNHSLSKANEWNEIKRFTRAYVESDGSIVLESDMSLSGGVSFGNIGEFFRLFRISLSVFSKEVL